MSRPGLLVRPQSSSGSVPTTLRAGESCPHRKDTGQGRGGSLLKSPVPTARALLAVLLTRGSEDTGSWTQWSDFLLKTSFFFSA